MIQKIKQALHSDKVKHGATKIERSSHFIYLGGAAFGVHEASSVAAGVIVVVLVVGFFLHWNLEG